MGKSLSLIAMEKDVTAPLSKAQDDQVLFHRDREVTLHFPSLSPLHEDSELVPLSLVVVGRLLDVGTE